MTLLVLRIAMEHRKDVHLSVRLTSEHKSAPEANLVRVLAPEGGPRNRDTERRWLHEHRAHLADYAGEWLVTTWPSSRSRVGKGFSCL